MKLSFAFLAFACLIYVANCYNNVYAAKWKNFKLQHGKVYKDSSEDLQRMKIWIRNRKIVKEHNELFRQRKVSYSKEINKFSDMTKAELKNYAGLKFEKPKANVKKRIFNSTIAVDLEIDWRKLGAVTNVKDQRKCGSCYAFSVVGAIEAQHFIKTNQLVSLSAQQIVDCSKNYTYGCLGGQIPWTYDYIEHFGLENEDSYPYRGDDGKCQFDENKIVSTIYHFDYVAGYEIGLVNAVASVGPASTGIYVAESFYFYKSGIYDEPACRGVSDHAVLVIGFGTENGKDYW